MHTPAEEESIPSGLRPLVVVVVDDVPAIRSLIRAVLEPHVTVLEAGDADTAWGIITDRCPAAVICDARSPGRGGLALLRDIRQEASLQTTAVILVSGDDDSCRVAQKLGADAVLAKPFSPAALARTVWRTLDRQR